MIKQCCLFHVGRATGTRHRWAGNPAGSVGKGPGREFFSTTISFSTSKRGFSLILQHPTIINEKKRLKRLKHGTKLRLRKNDFGTSGAFPLSNERLNYCKHLNFDVLGLSELHNVQNKSQWQEKHGITSKDTEIDEQGESNVSSSKSSSRMSFKSCLNLSELDDLLF